jgi:hypothetical protein
MSEEEAGGAAARARAAAPAPALQRGVRDAHQRGPCVDRGAQPHVAAGRGREDLRLPVRRRLWLWLRLSLSLSLCQRSGTQLAVPQQ